MKDFPSLWYASVIEGDPLPVQWVVQTVVTWCETFFTSFKGVQFGASHRHKDSFLWCRNKVHCTQHNSLVKKRKSSSFSCTHRRISASFGSRTCSPPFFCAQLLCLYSISACSRCRCPGTLRSSVTSTSCSRTDRSRDASSSFWSRSPPLWSDSHSKEKNSSHPAPQNNPVVLRTPPAHHVSIQLNRQSISVGGVTQS